MNPEAGTDLGQLAGIAVVASLTYAWIAAGGLRRVRARLQSRRGGKR